MGTSTVQGQLTETTWKGAVGRYRWRICALLFAATTLNYIDRQVLGVLAPFLGRAYGWSELDYSYIVDAFQAAYAIGLVFAGAVIDRIGTRLGYALAIAIWSVAAMSHALARSVMSFAAARFMLGLGESGNFPAAVKTVAEWFEPHERAFATGLFNAGSNIGAIIAPLAVPLAVSVGGLKAGFLFTGVLSMMWLAAWLTIYRPPAWHAGFSPTDAPSEASIRASSSIDADGDEARGAGAAGSAGAGRLRWSALLGYRQTWAVMAAKFLTDPIWWFFLFWLPKILNAKYALTLGALGPPLVAIYLMADGGSIAGGWLVGWLMRRGFSLDRARKGAMLVCATTVVPIVLAPSAHRLWETVGLFGLATASHQGWSANVYTLASDLFPTRAVGSVVGLAGFAGAVSGIVFSTLVGWWLQRTGSYVPMLIMAGSAYWIALAVVHWLVPRLAPARL
ncbi:MAG TPA: MFS transporter [Steroidobacteraceae bacterium]|jgi:ACS family hexuronate transporter-like MFS transporter